jgi:hypothetical protein
MPADGSIDFGSEVINPLYSVLSVVMGSMRVARKAGRSIAATATTTTRAVTAAPKSRC